MTEFIDPGKSAKSIEHRHPLVRSLQASAHPPSQQDGNIYFYFICRGVQEHDCDLPSLPVAKVEKAVTDHYARVTIPAQHRATFETLAADACADSTETTTKLRATLWRQLTELDRQEDRYLDLLGDPDWPEQRLKPECATSATTSSESTGNSNKPHDTLEPGRAVLAAALDLLDRPRDLYTTTEHARKLLNKAIFARLYGDVHPTRQPPVTTRRSPRTLQQPHARHPDHRHHRTTTRLSGRRPDTPRRPYSPPPLRVGWRVRPLWWRCRESNPGPPSPRQGFSVRSPLRLYSDPPVTRTSRCDDPSRCRCPDQAPRPGLAVKSPS
jgi:hypothetical protein